MTNDEGRAGLHLARRIVRTFLEMRHMANGNKLKNGKEEATLGDLLSEISTSNRLLHEEIRMANRLLMANLALGGVQQKDIAAVIGKVDSVVSETFPKGLLRKLAK